MTNNVLPNSTNAVIYVQRGGIRYYLPIHGFLQLGASAAWEPLVAYGPSLRRWIDVGQKEDIECAEIVPKSEVPNYISMRDLYYGI
ncbi:hypothetical protein SEA_FORZA_189 [Gordonia phage Forza]|uniref:Uncharacterized protein n=1 Tax=Gordonia phage Forza TaxID=2571247 RepID=A0A650EYN4_9CAUD|nr:hypothetical protein PP303_gp139 [Gordonia phage Forza]QEM41625.1 hypothetical protein SEA_BOOPY_189 [Gordonia phage Boopy]QGT55150.1 hypothetical protein SEA_FORZA_189 [Gordonia phage Forza]UXE04298.1 hypothetical protein SEA_BLUENGOLD_185 [Gordonia phage BlueNGold]WBF03939.1 hypothetical protein SEA_MAREELIH_186 [Gordonia phage Mareelih]